MSTIISAAIIIVVLILIFMLLITLHKKDQKRTTARLLDQFNAHAQKNNLAIAETGILKDSVFGLDDLYNKFLIVQLLDRQQYNYQIIDLNRVKRCSVIKNNRYAHEVESPGKKSEIFVGHISLLFEFNDNEEPVELFFYKHIEDHIFEMKELEQKAVKWQALISKKIKYRLMRIA